jgi:uncharacterized protein (TIGR02453 family)
MIQKTTMQFLKDLSKNNNKPWFDTNRKKYEAAKENVIALVAQLLQGVGNFDKAIGELEAKKCMFRINRDVRFSSNKEPYKTNMGAWFNAGGKKEWNGGYYLHIEPGNCFMAAGLYQPDADKLSKVRQEIDYNYQDFKKIVENKNFMQTFGTLSKEEGMVLSRPPKGYDINNEAIDYIKHKSFVARKKINDDEIMDKNIVKKLVGDYKLLYPFIKFLNEAIV